MLSQWSAILTGVISTSVLVQFSPMHGYNRNSIFGMAYIFIIIYSQHSIIMYYEVTSQMNFIRIMPSNINL